MPSSIFEFVKEARDNYRSQTVQVADGYEFSQYETLRTIDLYLVLNPRYISACVSMIPLMKSPGATIAKRSALHAI